MNYLEKDNKEKIARDLLNLYNVTRKYSNIFPDTKPLYDASEECRSMSSESRWKYAVNSLRIKVPEEGTIPNSFPQKHDSIELYFSCSVQGKYFNPERVYDPLEFLEFNIEIEGLGYLDNSDAYDIYSSWHLDKHSQVTGGKDTGSKYIHPEYHFTFGGKKLKEQLLGTQSISSGLVFIPSTPRLPHPPMDAVLGVDFILQQFISSKYRDDLLFSPEYQDVIRRSQARIWKKYATAFASHWNPDLKSDMDGTIDCEKLYPNIIHLA
ncbi:MAG: hypothetical protein AAFP89_06660 [Bacteroidota bacterium]